MKKINFVLWHFPVLGFLNAATTFLLGIVFIAMVVGIPLGKGMIQYAKFLLNPEMHRIEKLKQDEIKHNQHWNAFGMFVYVLYFPISLVLVLLTLVQLALLSVTVVGLPLAKKIWKNLKTCFNPVDKKCVF
ncbi:hypothetical protein ACFLT1_06735 [Bacteroidota bacterium]